MASFHLISLIVVVMACSSSALIDTTQCISYRYLPCIDGKSKDPTLISKNETIVKYTETTCIVYQFLPCQNGSESLSLMYNNGSSKDPSTSCQQNQTAPASTVLQTKSFCEPSLTSCLGQKDDDWEIRYYKSFIEKKSLSDTFLLYMVSVFNTRIIDEEVEKVKLIKDRMQDYIRYSVARLGLNELVDVPKLIPAYGVVYNDILSIKYPINVPGCNGAATSSLPSLFVAVTGVATDDNQKSRDKIRTLFNKEIPDLNKHLFSSINFAFFLGKPEDSAIQNRIQQESNTKGDVIQMDVIDTGRNGSLKLAAIFNWVRQFCGNVSVVFKIDENFEHVTLKKLGKALPEKSITDTFVYGIKGDVEKKMISKEEFPWTRFPEYFNGLAYFITGNMIEPLMAAFQTVPMLPLEDVYLGICIIKSGMKRSTICGTDFDSSSCF